MILPNDLEGMSIEDLKRLRDELDDMLKDHRGKVKEGLIEEWMLYSDESDLRILNNIINRLK